MSDGFVICRLVLGSAHTIEIAEDDYNLLLGARRSLMEVTSAEEKFLAVCEHYRETEEYVLKATLNNMIFVSRDTSEIRSIGAQFGRISSSLLSSIRLYQDSIASHVKAVSGGRLTNDEVTSIMREEYDTHLSYRVMEAIRNHSQHRAFPVHGAKYNVKRNEEEALNYSSDFYFDVEKVLEDKKFKATVKKELQDTMPVVDLKVAVRQYFGSICRIHHRQRQLMRAGIQEAESVFEKYQAMWNKSIGQDDLVGVAACKLSNGFLDKTLKPVYLTKELDEYRKDIEDKTSLISNMERRRVLF